jgi:hypothetical protein
MFHPLLNYMVLGEGTGKGTAHFGPHLPMIEKNMVNDSEIDQRTYTQTIGECHYR